MASFSDVEREQPEFAGRVRAAFDAHRHKIMATLRADGAPRVSGIESAFAAGELWVAGMPRSVKFADLRRDPRMALHSGSDEPDSFSADAKVSGRAVEVADPAERRAFAEATSSAADGGYELFRVDLEQVVLTAIAPQPGRGLTEVRRT